jgi:hypothetical protein
MAKIQWLAMDGKPVKAMQFGKGQSIPRGVQQDWDRKGAFYVCVIGDGPLKGQRVRLSDGDFVCYAEGEGEDWVPCNVQSEGRFLSAHSRSAATSDAPKEEPPRILTTKELEAEILAPGQPPRPEPEPVAEDLEEV